MKRRGRAAGGRRVTDRGGGKEGPRADGGPVRHTPVLLAEAIGALAPQAGERMVDATFGAGGYTRALLEAAPCAVLGLDRDPDAVAAGEALRAAYPGRLTLIQTRFSQLEAALRDTGWDSAHGIVFDLGVSSMQLDQAERGFSFMRDGPLDMRMSREGPSAAGIVNSLAEAELADIIRRFGEERRARAIAAAIVKARERAPLARTAELAELVARVLGRRHGEAKHPATRTFQALRMAVNAELAELEAALAAAERALAPGGRLAVVSFHSLEDRMVKRFLMERSGRQPAASRHLPAGERAGAPAFRIPRWHGVAPSAAEIAANPRAHSARLRWAIRT